MKIVRITVTDDEGVDHTWEGRPGFLIIRSFNKKGEPYQEALDAHLVLPPKPDIKESDTPPPDVTQ